MADGERNYPNLAACRVVLCSATASAQPPVRMPEEVLQAAEQPLPPLYDFALERQILARKIEREEELAALRATSPEALQEGIVAKMRHLTKGDERTCRRLLELHNYDLKSAVDAYY